MTAAPLGLLLVPLGLLGLLVGSFLNVVIHRVPDGLSILRPGSRCPTCAHRVRAYDNIPVLSWLALRGRCRDCDGRISWRYPAVELGTAALFLVVGWRFGLDTYLPAALVLVSGGLALLMVDLDRQRLPFAMTGTLALLVVAGLAFDVSAGSVELAASSLLSVALWLAVYGGVWLVTAGRGMGLGDVALAPVLGLALGWLGWGPSLVGLLGGFVIGAAVGMALMLLGRAGRRTRVPHGPSMLAGAALGMLGGQSLWSGYLALFGIV